jgi:hypothetical protein
MQALIGCAGSCCVRRWTAYSTPSACVYTLAKGPRAREAPTKKLAFGGHPADGASYELAVVAIQQQGGQPFCDRETSCQGRAGCERHTSDQRRTIDTAMDFPHFTRHRDSGPRLRAWWEATSDTPPIEHAHPRRALRVPPHMQQLHTTSERHWYYNTGSTLNLSWPCRRCSHHADAWVTGKQQGGRRRQCSRLAVAEHLHSQDSGAWPCTRDPHLHSSRYAEAGI